MCRLFLHTRCLVLYLIHKPLQSADAAVQHVYHEIKGFSFTYIYINISISITDHSGHATASHRQLYNRPGCLLLNLLKLQNQ